MQQHVHALETSTEPATFAEKNAQRKFKLYNKGHKRFMFNDKTSTYSSLLEKCNYTPYKVHKSNSI